MGNDPQPDALLAEQQSFYVADALEYDKWLRTLEATDNDDPVAVSFREGRERVVRLLRDGPPLGKVLDIAAGTGILSELAARAGADSLVLLDTASASLQFAADRLAHINAPVELINDDVFTWDTDRRFDTIMFSSWFHHVPRTEVGRFWRIIECLLAPGGQVLFDVPTDEPAAITRTDELPATPTEEYSLYTPVDGVGIRDHLGRRWTLAHELWTPEALVAELEQLGWNATVSVPGWWQSFVWLRVTRR